MKELMIHVERVVRPVRALESRKDRMREELLAHLTSIFEEELARQGDRDAAFRESVRRFGEPAALTRELEASAPRQESMGVVLERWLRRRRGEATPRYMLRLTGVFALYCVMCALMVTIINLLLPDSDPFSITRWRIGASFLLFTTALTYPEGLVYFRMRAALCRPAGTSRSWWRAGGWALVSGLLVPLFWLGGTWAALGSLSVSLELLYLCYPYMPLIPAALAGLALYFGRAQLRHREWVSLDLGT
jgi:hypothetical protein